MEEISFVQSRSGSLTCSVRGIFLHSRFDPIQEAHRFLETQTCEYIPSVVVLIAPCLGHVVPFISARWPDSRILAIQCTTGFSSYDSQYEKVFYYTENTGPQNISDQLFGYLGEETAFSTLFISWTPAEKIWPQATMTIWNGIKTYMNTCRDVAGTRNYFNRRWLKNMIRFFSLSTKCSYTEPFHTPVVICASGPTLKEVFPLLQKHRNRFFLLALSSALAPLAFHDIIPDAVLSTDGGWYASRHLEPFFTDKRLQSVPLWVSCESHVPSRLLMQHPLQYVSYGDIVENWLFEGLLSHSSAMKPIYGLRNGTVSGTALSIAGKITDGAVFFCGLDLAVNQGFQHCQPNRIELSDATFDDRIKPAETRITPKTFTAGSLEIYRNWFCSRPQHQVADCFRVLSAEDMAKNARLGYMRDILPEELEQHLISSKHTGLIHACRQYLSEKDTKTSCTIIKGKLLNLDATLSHSAGTSLDSISEAFIKSCALPEFLMAKRNADTEQLRTAIEKSRTFLSSLIQLVDDISGVQ